MQQFQTSDRVRLSYTDQGDGPPVVLIAGFTAPAATWYFTEQALLDVGYRVIAFDRRNHGASDAPPYGQRLSRHGKDLHELLDWLSLDAAYLVGGSMGASSIWAYFDLFHTPDAEAWCQSTRRRSCSTSKAGTTASMA